MEAQWRAPGGRNIYLEHFTPLIFWKKGMDCHGHRHLPSSGKKGQHLLRALHIFPLLEKGVVRVVDMSSPGQPQSSPGQPSFSLLGKGRGGHDHKPPHLSGEGKGCEEKREASQRYHMEAQLKSPLCEKHLPRALHTPHLLEKGNGLSWTWACSLFRKERRGWSWS